MQAKKEICILCAWRETCQKKFSVSGRDVRCPEFVKDLSIKEGDENQKSGEKKDGG